MAPPLAAEVSVRGIVVDLNGQPVGQAMVSLRGDSPHSGADVITVFTGPDGGFSFPEPFADDVDAVTAGTASALGYEPHQILSAPTDLSAELTVIMRGTANQAGSAPASAWLTGIKDREEKARFVRNCIDCHQVPSAEVRAYAKQIAEVRETDPAVVREQSWSAMIQYMNFLSVEEFSRGRETGPPEASRAYAVREHAEIIETLTTHFTDSMEELSGYDYGAPLLVSDHPIWRSPRFTPTRTAALLSRFSRARSSLAERETGLRYRWFPANM